MARHSSLVALCLALGFVATAQGQFSFGIGTGGGSGFYYGRGGGYYGPGYYGGGYYGPGYYGPGYGRSGVGIRVGNFGYYDYDDDYSGGYYYSQPQVNNYYVLPSNSVQSTPSVLLPDNKVSASKPKLRDGDILLKSPEAAPGNVGYGINDKWVYTIKPGQKQTLEAGRKWTIEFHRGIDGAEPARYALEPGVYEFRYSQSEGWELQRVKEGVLPSPPDAPLASDDAPETSSSKKSVDDAELPAEPPPE